MNKPVVWTIAGTDPSAGAGIQADLKTISGLGAYGCTVITAVIAQNTRRVAMVEFPSDKMLAEQLAVLREDVPPAAIKIGMLGTALTVRTVMNVLEEVEAPVVYDPVMASTSGASLLEPLARNMVVSELLPRSQLVTPNLAEAEALSGERVRTQADMEQAARALLARGAKSVLIKGGHLEGGFCQDYWSDGKNSVWLTSLRRDTPHTHGSGCTLSSAAATCLALGYDVLDAVVIAKTYVNQGIRLGGGIGSGRGPLAHEGWPCDPDDLPWITAKAEPGLSRRVFPDCGREPLGLYPLVDSTAWMEKLLPLGVSSIQLRIKSSGGADGAAPSKVAIEEEIRRAVEVARRFNCRLFVNDYWDLALKHGAYGVHLGPADIEGADLAALGRAGVRLGLSAYGYTDLARAAAVRPSYVGIGAVFPTPSKTLGQAPLGLDRFTAMRRLAPGRAVAIGGLTLENAPPVIAAGADGIAVISDTRDAADVEGRVRGWLKLFE
ncbi:MAG: bifunctional hydroxymethylpyrimidine kinase/phosphomethylpyrimidine kinase [Kiritimatiellae bacterium]|nr:bifunctional hydroxymethylpyrimidine kinase/phosphomethylpyrimidine kinase [Kiritimatiellia bacterium]